MKTDKGIMQLQLISLALTIALGVCFTLLFLIDWKAGILGISICFLSLFLLATGKVIADEKEKPHTTLSINGKLKRVDGKRVFDSVYADEDEHC